MGIKEQWGFSFQGSNQVVISLEALSLDTFQSNISIILTDQPKKKEKILFDVFLFLNYI